MMLEKIGNTIIVTGTLSDDDLSRIKFELNKNDKVVLDLSRTTGLETIKYKAFEGFTELMSVKIPSSVEIIGIYAFDGCTGLTNVKIPSSVKTIGSGAFSGCTGLTGVIVDAGNTAYKDIDGVLFTKDERTLIYYPAGKSGCTYDIPSSVTTIGEDAFDDYTELTSVTIPKGVTTIECAFSGCSKLTDIIVDAGNTVYKDIDGVLFTKDEKTLIHYPAGKSDRTYDIPSGVTTIENCAFADNPKLTSMTIPKGVTTIEGYAFSGCTRLTDMIVDSENTKYKDIDGVLFTKDEKTLIHYPAGKNGNTYNIPSSVKTIEDGAFYGCKELTNVTIPEGVEMIKPQTFDGCSRLTSVTIPSSLKKIRDDAFWDCAELSRVIVDAGNTAYKDIDGVLFTKDERTLIYYPAGKIGHTYDIPSSVETIGWDAFKGCTRLTDVKIPERVKEIWMSAFKGCTGLTNVTIPSSMRTVGWNVFADCVGLTSVTIPKSVITIGGNTFRGCTGLTSVTIPKNVIMISDYAFKGCAGLTNITVEATNPPTIIRRAFDGCNALKAIYVPRGSVTRYQTAEGWRAYSAIIQAKV